MTLDDALLDLDVAIRAILIHRPRHRQDAVRAAVAAVRATARAEAEGTRVDPAEQLQAALERAAAELGWSGTMIIVNKLGRVHAGPPRREAERATFIQGDQP